MFVSIAPSSELTAEDGSPERLAFTLTLIQASGTWRLFLTLAEALRAGPDLALARHLKNLAYCDGARPSRYDHGWLKSANCRIIGVRRQKLNWNRRHNENDTTPGLLAAVSVIVFFLTAACTKVR